MRYYIQRIYDNKRRIDLGNGKFVYSQIYDKQTITKSGRITHHTYYIKYKGVKYSVTNKTGTTWKKSLKLRG